MVIRTGDGVVYTPQYVMATVSREVEYNIDELLFIDISGSLVKRRTPRGMRYDVEIRFQGADCVDVGHAFRKSADYVDKKTKFAPPWEMTHPIFDKILVQPARLRYDHSSYNVVTIKGTLIETIKDNGTALPNNLPALVESYSATALVTYTAVFKDNTPAVTTATLSSMSGNTKGIYTTIKAKLNGVQDDVNTWNTAYSTAEAKLNTALYTAEEIITQVQALYAAPADFSDTVANRLKQLQSALDVLNAEVADIGTTYGSDGKNLRRLYEVSAGSIVGTMCKAAVTNVTTDYDRMVDVLSIYNQVLGAYNAYIVNLYTLQTASTGTVDSYHPDHDGVNNVAEAVYTTLAALYELSKGAQQQRSIVLTSDSNIILLGYELYPELDNDTSALLVKNDNDMGLSELMVVEKGREVLYYV